MADLERLDGRAREHTNLEQPLLASDLIFTDGLELVARAATNVELARATERTTRNETVRAARSSQATMVAWATGTSLLAVLLLVPVNREASTGPFEPIDAEEGKAVSTDEVMLPGVDRLMRTDPYLDAAEAAAPATTPTTIAPAATDTVSTDPVPDLRIAAELCTDLCKLTDTTELAALLGRTAALMNASGLIIWVRDSSGRALRPAIGHGYSGRTLTRLGLIPEDGANATAAAYRCARMQIVDHDDTTNGALAVPLMAAGSCMGVLSAELREGWESSAAVQATAAILAAQLATLISADPPVATAAPPAKAHG